MDNLKEKIENLVSNQEDTTNDLLLQILQELKKVNINLKRLNKTTNNRKGRDYYNFVNKLRKDLKADIDKNIYPEIRYNNRKIGVTLNGYLYDKTTNENLKAYEAYEIYEYLYKNRDKLGEFIGY